MDLCPYCVSKDAEIEKLRSNTISKVFLVSVVDKEAYAFSTWAGVKKFISKDTLDPNSLNIKIIELDMV